MAEKGVKGSKGSSMGAMRRAAGKRLGIQNAEDDAYVDYTSGKTGGHVRAPLNRMVSKQGDVRLRKGQKAS